MYEADQVDVVWHGKLHQISAEPKRLMLCDSVPNHDEIEFVLEILDKIASPALDKVETLLETAGKWDSVARNDFCR